MKFNQIDTAAIPQSWADAWSTVRPDAPMTAEVIACALAMPSLVHGGYGLPSKGGQNRRAGKGNYYLATAFAVAAAGGVKADADVWAAADLAGIVDNNSKPWRSNKTVYISDLGKYQPEPLIAVPGARTSAVVLTDAGIARVREVCGAELARFAKANLSQRAYEKAVKASAKAARAAAKAGVAEVPTLDAEAEAEAPVELPVEAKAEAEAQAEAQQ